MKRRNAQVVPSFIFEMASSTIPTISLADLDHHSETGLSELRNAVVNVGFMYIKNFVLPKTESIDKMSSTLLQLFHLPVKEKTSAALVNSPHFLGYSGFGTETTGEKQDWREQFELATELPENSIDPRAFHKRLHGPNQLPIAKQSDDVSARRVIDSYISQMSKLARSLLASISTALGLPPGAFDNFVGPQHRLKLVHYVPTANMQSLGAHKDSSGLLTILHQPNPPHVGGLQALAKDGTWLDVPPIPGTFVVNFGQAFEVLTDGLVKATTHRVLMDPVQGERYSVPFFLGIRGDLTRTEALAFAIEHFGDAQNGSKESDEASSVDSAWLRGKYETWGESQLRTKIRSHRDVGRRWYADVYDKYINDD